MEKFTFTRARLFYVRDIMVIMCVSMVESLCQTSMGWIPALKYVLSGASRKAINATTFRYPRVDGAYPLLKAPRWGD
jgi:hypothetical protein